MKNINIEVVFATEKLQKIIPLTITADMTIIEIIALSRVNDFFVEYDLLNDPNIVFGVWGKRILDLNNYKIVDGSRLEIYRKLQSTPNQKRLSRTLQ